MFIVGITGGIASGKSTVSEMLKGYGLKIIDADKIARQVSDDKEILDIIRDKFGNDIFEDDGSLNRKKLGNLVFTDCKLLNTLNRIMLPEIRKRILSEIKRLKDSGEKACVLDAALLIEDNYTEITDIVVIVHVPEKIQVKRLMKRNGFSESEALSRVRSQMPYKEKIKYANYVIDNSYNIEYTYEQVNKIVSDIKVLED